jgi:hypothetical protein
MVNTPNLSFSEDVIYGLLDLYIDVVMIFCKPQPELQGRPSELCVYLLETT